MGTLKDTAGKCLSWALNWGLTQSHAWYVCGPVIILVTTGFYQVACPEARWADQSVPGVLFLQPSARIPPHSLSSPPSCSQLWQDNLLTVLRICFYCRVEEGEVRDVFQSRGENPSFDETSCVATLKLGFPQSEVRVACCRQSHGLSSKSHLLWDFVKFTYIWPTQSHKHKTQNVIHFWDTQQEEIAGFFFMN